MAATIKNALSPINFQFTIKKLPTVNLYVQQVTLPSLTLGASNILTPFIKLPIPGDHLVFGDLNVTFKVDEDLKNYKEMYDWIIAVGFPDSFDQYKAIASQTSGLGIYSDATLIILNSAKNPNYSILFTDLYPIALTELTFDTRATDVEYLEATATFAFKSYTINKIT